MGVVTYESWNTFFLDMKQEPMNNTGLVSLQCFSISDRNEKKNKVKPKCFPRVPRKQSMDSLMNRSSSFLVRVIHFLRLIYNYSCFKIQFKFLTFIYLFLNPYPNLKVAQHQFSSNAYFDIFESCFVCTLLHLVKTFRNSIVFDHE